MSDFKESEIRRIVKGGSAEGKECAMDSREPNDYVVLRTVEHDPTLPHITLGDVVLHSETFGDPESPVVIVVHGGPGVDYRNLLPLKALADEFFVVFYDQRGSGLSPRIDDEQLTYESALADLEALVDRYGASRKVSLIGHSWGAMLVSGYLGRHPDKVVRVVLAEPPALARGADLPPEYRISPGFLLQALRVWIVSRWKSGPDGDVSGDYFMGRMTSVYERVGDPFGYFCNGKVPPAALEHWRLGRRAMTKVPKSYSSRKAFRLTNVLDVSFVEGVESFTEEVLFVAGSCNVIFGEELQREHMEYFPTARLVVINGVGHEMFGENPDASILPVREYLRSQSGSAARAAE